MALRAVSALAKLTAQRLNVSAARRELHGLDQPRKLEVSGALTMEEFLVKHEAAKKAAAERT